MLSSNSLVKLLFICLYCGILMPLYAQSYITQIDSLKQILRNTPPSPEKVAILNRICKLSIRSTPDSIMPTALKALTLAQELDDKRGMLLALKNKSFGHHVSGHPIDSSLVCQQASVRIAEEIGDYETIALWHNNIGYILKKQKSYPKALASLLAGVEILDQYIEKPSSLKATLLGNIGEVLVEVNDIDQAIIYFEHTLNYSEENGFELPYSAFIHDYAVALYLKGETALAFATFDEAVELQTKLSDYKSLIQTYMNYADCLLKEKRYAEARTYVNYALELQKVHQYDAQLLLVKLSEVELADGNVEAALAAAEKAYTKFNKNAMTQNRARANA